MNSSATAEQVQDGYMISAEAALQVSVTALPIIALVATYAVDSIEEQDPLWYRVIVLVLGLSALTTVAPAIYTGLAGGVTEISTNQLLLNLAESVTFVVLLTIGVMLKESLIGLTKQTDVLKTLFPVLVMLILIFQIVLPTLEKAAT